jgi:hypothetical protein
VALHPLADPLRLNARHHGLRRVPHRLRPCRSAHGLDRLGDLGRPRLPSVDPRRFESGRRSCGRGRWGIIGPQCTWHWPWMTVRAVDGSGQPLRGVGWPDPPHRVQPLH